MSEFRTDAPHRHSNHWNPLILLLATGMAGGLIGGLVGTLVANDRDAASFASTSCAVTAVASADLPAVVTIRAGNGSAARTGSGSVISPSGYILTNDHVLPPSSSSLRINVVFNDSNSMLATVVGRDPETDLAVIKVRPPSPLPTLSFGDSTGLRVGQQVIALGAPLALAGTVTSGIVSALNRTVQVPHDGKSAYLVDVIQTDAAINPGNSGGALVDCRGDLVGVPTAAAGVPTAMGTATPGSIGLGFAVPAALAQSVASDIMSTGTAARSYLGLAASSASWRGRSGDVDAGLLVTSVAAGGPAFRAGLRVGDVILAADGEATFDPSKLLTVTLTRPPGETVTISFRRGRRPHTVNVILGSPPMRVTSIGGGDHQLAARS